ncbi:hypothetical protein [Belnapia rosea]|uniref:hypothetical protein n=1 Tax=Belnapia rosea TaxID=938405 RepID=UPI000B886044|nr:hypothetical protein [Belnapia rosea]
MLGGFPNDAALALRVFDTLVAITQASDGKQGGVHTASRDREVVSRLRDACDHAVIVLARRWLRRAPSTRRGCAKCSMPR